jgi:hypothetical protein
MHSDLTGSVGKQETEIAFSGIPNVQEQESKPQERHEFLKAKTSFSTKNGGGMFLRNVVNHLHDYRFSQHIRPQTKHQSLCKSKAEMFLNT